MSFVLDDYMDSSLIQLVLKHLNRTMAGIDIDQYLNDREVHNEINVHVDVVYKFHTKKKQQQSNDLKCKFGSIWSVF